MCNKNIFVKLPTYFIDAEVTVGEKLSEEEMLYITRGTKKLYEISKHFS